MTITFKLNWTKKVDYNFEVTYNFKKDIPFNFVYILGGILYPKKSSPKFWTLL